MGSKRLVGEAATGKAVAERFTVDGKGHGWMIFENDKPVGVEPSWDAASQRLRASGYRVRAEQRPILENQRRDKIKAGQNKRYPRSKK